MASQKDSMNFNMIDLSNMFDTCSKQIFVDDIHTMQHSKNIIARELFHQLTANFDKTFLKQNKDAPPPFSMDN